MEATQSEGRVAARRADGQQAGRLGAGRWPRRPRRRSARTWRSRRPPMMGRSSWLSVVASRSSSPWPGLARAARAMSDSSSSSDSMVSPPMPAARAASSSASVLPGPVKTIRSGETPARSTARSSPPDATSAPRPAAAMTCSTPGEGLALMAKATSTPAGSASRSRVGPRPDDGGVVDVQRRPVALQQLRPRQAGDHAPPRCAARCGAGPGGRHRSASSRATRAEVPASRYLTMTGTLTAMPCSRAQADVAGRAAGHDDRVRRHHQGLPRACRAARAPRRGRRGGSARSGRRRPR